MSFLSDPKLPTGVNLPVKTRNELLGVINPVISSDKVIHFRPWTSTNKTCQNEQYLSIVGFLESGEKAHLFLKVPAYFDVVHKNRVDGCNKRQVVGETLIKDLGRLGINPVRYETLEKNFYNEGYQLTPNKITRIYLKNFNDRRTALHVVQAQGYITASDSEMTDASNILSAHHRNFKMSQWMDIHKYKLVPARTRDPGSSFLDCNILADIADIEISAEKLRLNKLNRQLTLCWDIETDKNQELISIGITIHKSDEINALQAIVISRKESTPITGAYLYNCGSELGVLEKFAEVLAAVRPDLMYGFNDFEFDYRVIGERADAVFPDGMRGFYNRINPLNEEYIMTNATTFKSRFGVRSLKVNAEMQQKQAHILKCPGVVCVDIRHALQRSRGKKDNKSSLSYYLEFFQIGGKEDLTYGQMWELYESGDPEKINRLLVYNVVDSYRLQELMLKVNLMKDYMNFAKITRVELAHAVTRADGHKVTNAICYFGTRYKNQVFHHNTAEEKKAIDRDETVMGGLVQDCTKQLLMIPTAGIDAASLYPSEIAVKNISGDRLIQSNDVREYCKTHNIRVNVIPIRTTKREYTPEYVFHNKIDIEYGLLAFMLLKLKKKRDITKRIKLELGERREQGEDVTLELAEAIVRDEAIKRLMNTVYGVSANPTADFFQLCIGGSITQGGQTDITITKNLALSMGCSCWYGDTDSVYLSPPMDEIHRLAKEYFPGFNGEFYPDYWPKTNIPATETDKSVSYANSVAYATELVHYCARFMKMFVNRINAHLEELYGCDHLKFTYEETLLPAMYPRKKKYIGLPHVSTVNLSPKGLKDVFIRGFPCIQGNTDILTKTLSEGIFLELLNIHRNHEETVLDVVERQLVKLFGNARELDIRSFVKYATYKPDKRNIKLDSFVARMNRSYGENKLDIYKPPTPYDKFPYVIAQCDVGYDFFGRKKKSSRADQMEYVEVFQHEGRKIDFSFYLTEVVRSTVGILISYLPELRDLTGDALTTRSSKVAMKICKDIYLRTFEELQVTKPTAAILSERTRLILEPFSPAERQVLNTILQFEKGRKTDYTLVDITFAIFDKLTNMKSLKTMPALSSNALTLHRYASHKKIGIEKIMQNMYRDFCRFLSDFTGTLLRPETIIDLTFLRKVTHLIKLHIGYTIVLRTIIGLKN